MAGKLIHRLAMAVLTINDLDMYCDDTGQDGGPAEQTIVFIHGAIQSRAVWQPQIRHFQQNYRCVAYDLRGHGDTAMGTTAMNDEPPTLELLADDLKHLLDTLNIDRAILCGVSLGGMVALHFAAHHADRVEALILANTPMALSLSPAMLRLLDWINPYQALLPAFAIAGQRRTAQWGLALVDRLTPDGWISEAARAHFIEGFSTMKSDAIVRTYAAITEAGLPDLERMETPSLIVTGEHETGLIFRHSAEIARRLGRAEIVNLAGAGHVTNLDAPAAFNRAVAAFLTRWL